MTPEQIWQAALGELKLQLTQASFEARVAQAHLQAYELSSHTFKVAVAREQDRDWIRTRLAASIQRIMTGISGRPAIVEFVVSQEPLKPADDFEEQISPPEIDWSEFSVPSIFSSETLDTVDWSRAALQKPTLREYATQATDYFEAGIGLTLIGPPGVGKTHIAVGLLKVAALSGHAVHFIGVTDLLDQLRSTFGRDSGLTWSERRVLQRLATVDVLVLDDLRVDGLSIWGRDRLYAVLNPRWEESKPTIVTTNHRPEELASALSRERPGLDDGTLSRLLRSALTIQLDGSDYRLDRKHRALATVRTRWNSRHLVKQP